MDLVGLTPAGTGQTRQITSTATVNISIPSASGGVNAPTDAGTSTFPTRYASLLALTALSANVWVLFTSSATGTATTTTGGWSVVVPQGVTVLYRRPSGSGITKYSAVSDGTATFHVQPQAYDVAEIS